MNRRDFLIRSSCLAGAGLLARPLLAQTSAPSTRPAPATKAAPTVTEFRPLRRNVGLFTGRGGSIGWLVNKDALAVVDTQYTDTALVCLNGLPGRDGRKLNVVLNTHHHPDHTSGNGVFGPAAETIVAHANVPRLQQARAEKEGTVTRQVYADTIFPSVWRSDLGDEVVTAQYHGAAHTSGDAIVTFEKANVVHMGDLMFNRLYPAIDRVGGASIQHWIVVLEEVAKTYPADAIYIFGHGNPKFGVTGKRDDLASLRDYLTALLEYTQKQIAAGEAKQKIVALENFPGFPDFHQPLPHRLQDNLSVAYDELTEKKV
jgi:cyclase